MFHRNGANGPDDAYVSLSSSGGATRAKLLSAIASLLLFPTQDKQTDKQTDERPILRRLYSRRREVGRSVASVCLFVYLFVRAVKGKRLELSGFRHALTLKSKGQNSNPNPNSRELTLARRGSACRYDCTFL